MRRLYFRLPKKRHTFLIRIKMHIFGQALLGFNYQIKWPNGYFVWTYWEI